MNVNLVSRLTTLPLATTPKGLGFVIVAGNLSRLKMTTDVLHNVVPALLTEAEAIIYLRLDGQKADARKTLKYYREQKKLKSTKIGKNLLYSRKALDEFIETMTN